MSEGSQVCPKCGATIAADAPQGLCPKCLLQQASFPTETGPGTRHSRPAPPAREELASAFPHLQILELIGQGGMGFVFKARQPKLDRVVALKILAQPLAEQKMFAERFTREGRTLAKLNHPNIVTIHDFGQAGPFFYLLMEFVDGVNLRQAMRAGAVTAGQALAIVPRICEALQYAHNEGVLHRDIKPDNILLDARGRVKIADFGIAKLMAEAAGDNPLTGSGASLGTPHYMAPEQIERPDAVDHRADIFSLGVVFYEMLTGELPLGRFAAPSQKGNSDPRLDDIVFQTLEKQPERRPQSAEEVRTRVEGVSATAAPRGESAARAPSGSVRTARCYISTPEHLQSFWGKVNIYTDSGELRLDDEQLVFTRSSQALIIPLRAITGLALGQYPRLTKPTGLDYICITHKAEGQPRRILLTPHRSPWSATWETNTIVHDWFGAIQQAIKNKTGRTPESNPADLHPLAGAKDQGMGAPALKTAMLLALLVAVTLGAFYGMRELSRLRARPTEPPARMKDASEVETQSRRLEVKTVSRQDRTIALETASMIYGDEEIVPVIRYGQDPWVDNETTMSFETFEGTNYLARYQWRLPDVFSPEFEVAASSERLRVAVANGVRLNEGSVLPLFSATNGVGHVIAGGLKYRRAPIPSESETALRWGEVNLFGRSHEARMLNIQFAGVLPRGTWIECSVQREPEQRCAARTTVYNDGKLVVQIDPSHGFTSPLHDNRGKEIVLRVGEKTELYATTNASAQGMIRSVERAWLELKRRPERAE